MFTREQQEDIKVAKTIIMSKMFVLHGEEYIKKCAMPLTNSMFLTGGAIASILQRQEPKDWDIYFTHADAMTTLALQLNSYSNLVADVDDVYRETYGINGKMITNKAITMKSGFSFITMQYGSPEDIKSTFDYLHTTPHYDIMRNKLYISPAQYDACVNKKLIVNNKDMIKQYRREKFIQRGYTEC